jgi:hypothetical protein
MMIKKNQKLMFERACLIDGREGEREKLAQSRAIYFIQKQALEAPFKELLIRKKNHKRVRAQNINKKIFLTCRLIIQTRRRRFPHFQMLFDVYFALFV